MKNHQQTIEIYQRKSEEYVQLSQGDPIHPGLLRAMDDMPKAARILDLGCGTGHNSLAFADRGFWVDAWDASSAMLSHLPSHPQISKQCVTFDALNALAEYNCLVAMFSLLHLPKAAFPGMLARAQEALMSDGVLILGMKLGEGEDLDKLGRFYSYYSEQELFAHLQDAGFTVSATWHERARGLDGSESHLIVIYANA